MPSRWQRQFTCSWCGCVCADLQGILRTAGRTGWGDQWKLCGSCVDRLFDLRGKETYHDTQVSRLGALARGVVKGARPSL